MNPTRIATRTTPKTATSNPIPTVGLSSMVRYHQSTFEAISELQESNDQLELVCKEAEDILKNLMKKWN